MLTQVRPYYVLENRKRIRKQGRKRSVLDLSLAEPSFCPKMSLRLEMWGLQTCLGRCSAFPGSTRPGMLPHSPARRRHGDWRLRRGTANDHPLRTKTSRVPSAAFFCMPTGVRQRTINVIYHRPSDTGAVVTESRTVGSNTLALLKEHTRIRGRGGNKERRRENGNKDDKQKANQSVLRPRPPLHKIRVEPSISSTG